jgi:hypothetical protein
MVRIGYFGMGGGGGVGGIGIGGGGVATPATVVGVGGGGVVGTGTAVAGSPQPAIDVARFHPPSPLTSPHVDWNVRRIVFGEGL